MCFAWSKKQEAHQDTHKEVKEHLPPFCLLCVLLIREPRLEGVGADYVGQLAMIEIPLPCTATSKSWLWSFLWDGHETLALAVGGSTFWEGKAEISKLAGQQEVSMRDLPCLKVEQQEDRSHNFFLQSGTNNLLLARIDRLAYLQVPVDYWCFQNLLGSWLGSGWPLCICRSGERIHLSCWRTCRYAVRISAPSQVAALGFPRCEPAGRAQKLQEKGGAPETARLPYNPTTTCRWQRHSCGPSKPASWSVLNQSCTYNSDFAACDDWWCLQATLDSWQSCPQHNHTVNTARWNLRSFIYP